MRCEIFQTMQWYDWTATIVLMLLGAYKGKELIDKYCPMFINWLAKKIENRK